jgi:hypothetical protein
MTGRPAHGPPPPDRLPPRSRRRLNGKLIQGAGWGAEVVDKGIDGLGKAISQLG